MMIFRPCKHLPLKNTQPKSEPTLYHSCGDCRGFYTIGVKERYRVFAKFFNYDFITTTTTTIQNWPIINGALTYTATTGTNVSVPYITLPSNQTFVLPPNLLSQEPEEPSAEIPNQEKPGLV